MIPQMVLGGAMFTFDKLNRDISSADKVPFIAEFMPSRWIYEGLIVDQFKNNKFQRMFYDVEQEESTANFKIVYYFQELEDILDDCKKYIEQTNSDKDEEDFSVDLALLKNEIGKENKRVADIQYTQLKKINANDFNLSLYSSLSEHIEALRSHYTKRFTKASNKKDKMINMAISKYTKEKFNHIKDVNSNETISDVVLKVFEKNKILREGDKLIQNVEPIYQMPEPDGFLSFRTHFFAPKKHFGGKYYETLWFNIMMVWIFTILLYVVLYFDLLRKSFNFLGELKYRKK